MTIHRNIFELMIGGILLTTMLSISSYALAQCNPSNYENQVSNYSCDDQAKFLSALRGNHLMAGDNASTLIIERVSGKQRIALEPGSIMLINGPSGTREIIIPELANIYLKLPKDPANLYKIVIVNPKGIKAETDAKTYVFRITDSLEQKTIGVSTSSISDSDQLLFRMTKNTNETIAYTYSSLPTNGAYFDQKNLVLGADNQNSKDHNNGVQQPSSAKPEAALDVVQGLVGQ